MDWQEAEAIVKRLAGGYLTPGSGSKNIQGDIRSNNHYIEVKYTDKDYITFQRSWFDVLEKHFEETDLEVVLVVFSQYEGYAYWIVGPGTNPKWSSMKSNVKDLVEVINTKYEWNKFELDSLKDIKKDIK